MDFKLDFIGVGFSRCGTTWIARCLAEHPEICFSNRKEVHFFNNDYEYGKGLGYYRGFFPCFKDKKITGEYTPEYFINDQARERIRKDFPNVKYIFAVRNPVDRAFSHYLYRKRKTGKVYPIVDIFNQDYLPKTEQILIQGFYHQHLKKWIEGLDPSQYLVVVHEDSREKPLEFIQNIYRFLGADSSFVPPSVNQEINTSKGLRYHSRTIQNLYAYRTKMRRSIVGRSIINFLKAIGVGKLVGLIISKNIIHKDIEKEKEVLAPEMREKIKAVYREDTKQLEGLLGRNLNVWQ